MAVRPKAIFVGPEPIGTHLKGIRKDWDFVAVVPDIVSLWEGLNDQSIDSDIQVIITIDGFFKPDTDEVSFEQLIAMMYPHCLFIVIAYQPHLESQIRSRVKIQSHSVGYGEAEEYYFISPKKPALGIEDAIAQYVKNTDNTPIADILQGKEVEIEEEREEELNPAEQISNYNFDEIESDRLGRVIAVTSSKGGSGKSTVTTTLATYLAHSSINSVKEGKESRPLKVVILDLDVRDGQIGFLTGHVQPTVLHMRSRGTNEKTLSETLIYSERLKVDLLLAPKRPRLAENTPPEFYLELIQFLKKFYDFIILDTSVNYTDPLLEKVAYPIADQIVFVTDIVVTSVYSMARWIQEVTKSKDKQGMGIDPSKIGIVVNKSMANISMDGERIAKSAMGLFVLTVIPNNAKLLAHATNVQSMERVLQNDDLRGAFRMLSRRLVGRLYNLSDNVST